MMHSDSFSLSTLTAKVCEFGFGVLGLRPISDNFIPHTRDPAFSAAGRRPVIFKVRQLSGDAFQGSSMAKKKSIIVAWLLPLGEGLYSITAKGLSHCER